MIKILFVCHGNICRSPMAEFVLKKMLEKEGRDGEFYVASAATSSEEIWNGRGNPVYPHAKEELRRHGITCEGKRAVQLIPADYDEYDLIIGMDGANIRNMHRLFGGDPKGKIKKLLDYADGGDISDPW
ncbi:MAG: low molecular weight phosphotyrosine protein phosphatase, partial [Clostridia bacterium]|nr:low molecular weight phosphotyrosine protein phosphatase [Clostridia bacterium]